MSSALRGGGRSLSQSKEQHRARSLLVVVQVALAFILLGGSGLMIRTFQALRRVDLGFSGAKEVETLRISIPESQVKEPERAIRMEEEIAHKIEALPGVSAAAITDVPPLSDRNRSDTFSVVGRKSTTPDPNVEMYMATSDYFQTLGIPRLSGRDFGNENPTGPKVAIVSQSLAATLFGNENPIGRQITGAGQTYEIIGVAGNIKSRTLGEAQRPVL